MIFKALFCAGGCSPTQAVSGGDWTLSAPLGQCGMAVGAGNFDPNSSGSTQEYITFDLAISTSRGTVSISGVSGSLVGVGGLAYGSSVAFQCRYLSSLTTSSGQFTVQDTSVQDATVGYGNLNSNFAINLYSDNGYSVPIVGSIYIGSQLYNSVSFGLSATLSSQMNFYVKSCSLKIGATNDIQIVNGNCYSKATVESVLHLNYFQTFIISEVI